MSTFLILAAGNSTRFGSDKLREPINGHTLPMWAADFARQNGCTRLCVTVGRKGVLTNGEEIYHPVVEDIAKGFGSRPEIAFQSEDSYGPGAAITAWEGKITEPFTVLFGDNFYRGTMPMMFNEEATYFSYKTLDTNPRNLQLAVVQDGYIVEKPHTCMSGDYFCGFARFPVGFFDKLPQLQKSSRGEYEITDMINLLGAPVPKSLDECGIEWADITYKSDIELVEELAQ